MENEIKEKGEFIRLDIFRCISMLFFFLFLKAIWSDYKFQYFSLFLWCGKYFPLWKIVFQFLQCNFLALVHNGGEVFCAKEKPEKNAS